LQHAEDQVRENAAKGRRDNPTKGNRSDNFPMDGVRAALTGPLKKGTRINLEIRLSEETGPIKAKGRIVWSDGKECGIRFTSLNSANKKKLKKFTER